MTRTIRLFLLIEAATFFIASSIHGGFLIHGYAHRAAHVAETVIGMVLLAGLAVTWIGGVWVRRAGLGAQAFALLGTLVGLLTIALGVGPRTVPDVAYHILIVAVLISGLFVSARRAGTLLPEQPPAF
jgi:hypothetical protein